MTTPQNQLPNDHEMRPRPELAAKVTFLLRRAFPAPTLAIETHMSWVFLTGDHAYKLKKPVRHHFLDYLSLEARRRDCEAEVSLNQALAPGVYLGTIPLTSDSEGQLALDGEGEIVDWLVDMRRLHDPSMLGQRMEADDINATEVTSLVQHLVTFYRSAASAPTTPPLYRRALLEILSVDGNELLRSEHQLDPDRVGKLLQDLRSAIECHPDLDDRAGHVVEGHGDLRPEHVILGPRPLVIDRITFDRRLRLVDPLYDLALLSVECELFGAPGLGEDITRAYQQLADDAVRESTIHLYLSLRATTRARLSIAHLGDGDRDAPKWLDRTDRYLAIAEAHLLDFAAHTATTDSSVIEMQQITE